MFRELVAEIKEYLRIKKIENAQHILDSMPANWQKMIYYFEKALNEKPFSKNSGKYCEIAKFFSREG